MRKISLIPTFIIGGLGILLGLLFAFFAETIFDIVLVVCGILTLLSSIPQFVGALEELTNKKKIAVFDLIMSVITIVVGIMLIFYRNEIVMMIIGAYLLVFPLIRILIASRKIEQLKIELPSMILGVALFIVAPRSLVHILGRVAGGIIVALSIVYMVLGAVSYLKAKKLAQNAKAPRVFVDTDGNGTVDAIYVDTTNDGNFDTEIKIDENNKSE